jgi:tRNA C32,U32 (ribose-2'-O)-methylase TrmJ
MYSQNIQECAIIAREASSALLELKDLVDRTAENVRTAERQAIGMAIGRHEGVEALAVFRGVADALQSADFEAALSQARAKMQAAFARLSQGQAQ